LVVVEQSFGRCHVHHPPIGRVDGERYTAHRETRVTGRHALPVRPLGLPSRASKQLYLRCLAGTARRGHGAYVRCQIPVPDENKSFWRTSPARNTIKTWLREPAEWRWKFRGNGGNSGDRGGKCP